MRHFSHSVQLDVSAHFSALDDEEFFVVEGSGWRGRARSTSANLDFGQFLDVEFWDHKRWGSTGGFPKGGGPNLEKLGPRRVGPEGWSLKGGAHRVGGPKFRVFFFPLPPQFSFFSPSLGGPFVEFWWCF